MCGGACTISAATKLVNGEGDFRQIANVTFLRSSNVYLMQRVFLEPQQLERTRFTLSEPRHIFTYSKIAAQLTCGGVSCD
jgi:hypothetical protein